MQFNKENSFGLHDTFPYLQQCNILVLTFFFFLGNRWTCNCVLVPSPPLRLLSSPPPHHHYSSRDNKQTNRQRHRHRHRHSPSLSFSFSFFFSITFFLGVSVTQNSIGIKKNKNFYQIKQTR